MGSSANSSSFLILCLCLLVFTQKSLAYFVTVSFWTLFDFGYEMKLCLKILVWEVILRLSFASNCRYSSVKIIATKLTDWFFILSTILWHLTERKILVKFMNFPLKLFSKNCQEKISRTPHQKSSVNSNHFLAVVQNKFRKNFPNKISKNTILILQQCYRLMPTPKSAFSTK